jgi:hypothetical protein
VKSALNKTGITIAIIVSIVMNFLITMRVNDAGITRTITTTSIAMS